MLKSSLGHKSSWITVTTVYSFHENQLPNKHQALFYVPRHERKLNSHDPYW